MLKTMPLNEDIVNIVKPDRICSLSIEEVNLFAIVK